MHLLRETLERLTRGEISLDEAERALKVLAVEEVENLARLDMGRELRHGVPEVVVADVKSPADAAAIAVRVVREQGRVPPRSTCRR